LLNLDKYWCHRWTTFVCAKSLARTILSTYSFTCTTSIGNSATTIVREYSMASSCSLMCRSYFLLDSSFRYIKAPSKKQLTLPWWCLFIAYGVSLILAIVSIFFIIIRGIEFGDLKTQKWLTSSISGFFASILFIQPIQVDNITQFYHIDLHRCRFALDNLVGNYFCFFHTVIEWWYTSKCLSRRFSSNRTRYGWRLSAFVQWCSFNPYVRTIDRLTMHMKHLF
jgi:hypothetical protein